jgi:hypothetical protein
MRLWLPVSVLVLLMACSVTRTRSIETQTDGVRVERTMTSLGGLVNVTKGYKAQWKQIDSDGGSLEDVTSWQSEEDAGPGERVLLESLASLRDVIDKYLQAKGAAAPAE